MTEIGLPSPPSKEKFQADEDAIDTTRAFFSKEVSKMSDEELYQQLEQLREARVQKVQKTKRRTKKEKKATQLHALEQHIPAQFKEAYRNMNTDQKKAFLQKLNELQQKSVKKEQEEAKTE